MAKLYELSITMNEKVFGLLNKLSGKMGFRDLGHTIDASIHLLNLVIEAQEQELEIGTLNKENVFNPWIFPKVKKVTDREDFLGKSIECERCGKKFDLVQGVVYRESQSHEGIRFVDCLHCGWTAEF